MSKIITKSGSVYKDGDVVRLEGVEFHLADETVQYTGCLTDEHLKRFEGTDEEKTTSALLEILASLEESSENVESKKSSTLLLVDKEIASDGAVKDYVKEVYVEPVKETEILDEVEV